MRRLINFFAAAFMGLLMLTTQASAFFHVFGEDKAPTNHFSKEHLTSEFKYIAGLVIHGEHVMWRQATADVLFTARQFSGQNPDIAAQVNLISTALPALEKLPTEAFTNAEVREHFQLVHPVHDQVANLVRKLNFVAPESAMVARLNNVLLQLRAMYRDDAVCNYTAVVAQNRTANGDVPETIDYDFAENAKFWEMVERQDEASFVQGNYNLVVGGLFLLLLGALGLLSRGIVQRERAPDPIQI